VSASKQINELVTLQLLEPTDLPADRQLDGVGRRAQRVDSVRRQWQLMRMLQAAVSLLLLLLLALLCRQQ